MSLHGLCCSLVLALTLTSSHLPGWAQAAGAQITGSVAYRERIALPQDAVIDIQLQDLSVADVAAQVVAESMINAEGRQVPVPFALNYDPAQIVAEHRYSVRATIRSEEGMLLFSTTQAYPVITHDAPSRVNLVLHTVGHGPKPASSARKNAGSSSGQKAAADTSAKTAAPEAAPPGALTSAPGDTAMDKPQAAPAEASRTAVGETASSQELRTEEKAPSMEAPAAKSEAMPPAPQAESGSEQKAAQPELRPSEPNATQPVASSQTEHADVGAVSQTPASATTPESAKLGAEAEGKSSEPSTALPEAPSAVAKLSPPSTDSAPGSSNVESETTESAEARSAETAPESVPPIRPKAGTRLADTQWRLIELAGADVIITPPNRPVTLAFSPEGTRIAGSAGCNSYLGTFTDDNGKLSLHPGNMTLMGCISSVTAREQKFMAMLRSVDGFRINGEYLVLLSKGKVVAKFRNI